MRFLSCLCFTRLVSNEMKPLVNMIYMIYVSVCKGHGWFFSIFLFFCLVEWTWIWYFQNFFRFLTPSQVLLQTLWSGMPFQLRRCKRHPKRKGSYSNYMGVSKNSGTPKSSIFIGFSIINHPFWRTPIFGNTHINSQGFFLAVRFRECNLLSFWKKTRIFWPSSRIEWFFRWFSWCFFSFEWSHVAPFLSETSFFYDFFLQTAEQNNPPIQAGRLAWNVQPSPMKRKENDLLPTLQGIMFHVNLMFHDYVPWLCSMLITHLERKMNLHGLHRWSFRRQANGTCGHLNSDVGAATLDPPANDHISHLRNRKKSSTQKCRLVGDMLVPRRVYHWKIPRTLHQPFLVEFLSLRGFARVCGQNRWVNHISNTYKTIYRGFISPRILPTEEESHIGCESDKVTGRYDCDLMDLKVGDGVSSGSCWHRKLWELDVYPPWN